MHLVVPGLITTAGVGVGLTTTGVGVGVTTTGVGESTGIKVDGFRPTKIVPEGQRTLTP